MPSYDLREELPSGGVKKIGVQEFTHPLIEGETVWVHGKLYHVQLVLPPARGGQAPLVYVRRDGHTQQNSSTKLH